MSATILRCAILTLATLVVCGDLPLQAQQDDTVYLQSDSLIVAKVAGTNAYMAYSKHVGAWTRYDFPNGIEAIPVISDTNCAFGLKGKDIQELVAVDKLGRWSTHKLPKPTSNDCLPVIADRVAVVSVDGTAHAFSADLGTWDSTPADAQPTVSSDVVMIVTPNRIAAFSAQTAKWASAPTR